MANICIVSETSDLNRIESFVKAHVDNLAGNIHFLYGGTLPRFHGDGESLDYYESRFNRLLGKFGIGRSLDSEFNQPLQRGLIRYLRENDIHVVLAEYGTTGAQVFKICKALGIPFIN